MTQNSPNPGSSLREKFPNMRPITKAPPLATFNGFGLSVYGRRDFDEETGSYVKTHCICALFIPLVAVGAYRVVDAPEGGWYFLGKERLSRWARGGNLCVTWLALTFAVHLGWSAYTSSPQYQARQDLKKAATALKEGKPLMAAPIYRKLAEGQHYASEAREGLRSALDQCLQSDVPATVEGGLRVLAGVPARLNQPDPLVRDGFKRGLALVEKFRAKDPDGALGILQAAAALDPKSDTIKPLKIDLLKQTIAATSDNTNRVVELALIYENDQQMDECVKLLTPYRQKLGATEGARILGQHLLKAGNHEEAYGLLYPFVQARLQKLREIERSYTNTIASVYNRALEDLRAGVAGQSFYESYEKASKAEKGTMVETFIQQRMQRDPSYQRALAELKTANQIVPVTLDLGIVQLNRAQNLKDPAARKAELEAAEKTFLAIRGFAGETDEYRLFLGQVYYWLGKSTEGKELFDELLARNTRGYPILMALGKTLRDVGEHAQARALVEEAYRTTTKNQEKYAAAAMRAANLKDEDDHIAWLEKCDPDAAWVQVELNSARGKKALQQNNKPVAAQYLRKAVAGFANMPKSSDTLNNWGLACFSLYEVTGNPDDHKRGLALLEEAIGLDPGDSVLLNNTMYFLLTRAVMDVVGETIHLEAIGSQANLSMLTHLYQDDQGRAGVYQRLRENENMKKAVAYLDKALLLAPKNLNLYEAALSIHGGFRDLAELQKLQQRFHNAKPDLSEEKAEAQAAYRGGKDKEYLDRIQARIRQLETLLPSPGVRDHPPTFEQVTVSLVGLTQTASFYGGSADSQKLLDAARAADAAHSSIASRHALRWAYLFRASEELTRQSRDYAALVTSTRRAVAPPYLIAFLLEHGGPLAGLVRQNENVRQAVALEKERVERFPSWPSIDEWAVLRNVDPALAAKVASKIRESEITRLMDALQYQFNPMSASAVLEQYWTHKMLGDEKRAKEVYGEALLNGVPLPSL